MNDAPMPALLLADAAGLDLLNSIATPVDEEIDWIRDGEGLLSWLEQAGWVDLAVLSELRAGFEPAEFDALAAKVRDLREWFRDYVRQRKGRALVADDLQPLTPLNRLLERDERFRQLVEVRNAEGETALALRLERRWATPESLLMAIAERLAMLVTEQDFTYVKACEGARCTLLFADHTRGHARRWCSMALCGNRAKVAAHRARLKARENA